VHQAGGFELLHQGDVVGAPARRLAGGEALHVRLVVDPPGLTVDPAEAQRLADGLGPRDSGFPARAFQTDFGIVSGRLDWAPGGFVVTRVPRDRVG
jgi:hypothetical protein